MTLKKFLKKFIPKDQMFEIHSLDTNFVWDFGYKSEIRKEYMNLEVKRIEAYEDNLIIKVIEPKPKRSTDNKAYKKWMKKYVKSHLDEIRLRDGEDAMD